VCDGAHVALRPIVLCGGLGTVASSIAGGGSSIGGARGGGLGTMQYLLILLVAVTMACGAAASVTIALVPAYADDGGKGY
jgi:hypothetical protein